MKTNLKDNIWIEGFDSIQEQTIRLSELNDSLVNDNDLIFCSKTSEIPEEIAKEILKIDDELSSWEDVNDIFYVDYKFGFSHSNFNDSIQSACNQEYCIIYKANNDNHSGLTDSDTNKLSCPLCHGTGFYHSGGSFGGSEIMQKCLCELEY